MAPTIRLATEHDLPSVLTLIHRYYTEWDIWQRDTDAAILQSLQQAPLGYFLAEIDKQPAGCVLIRPLPELGNVAECKRLFVTSEFRGHHLADRLMDVAESAAHTAGFDWMYLDTKSDFAAAIALYRRRGYIECPRYNDNAQATIFMRLTLNY